MHLNFLEAQFWHAVGPFSNAMLHRSCRAVGGCAAAGAWAVVGTWAEGSWACAASMVVMFDNIIIVT